MRPRRTPLPTALASLGELLADRRKTGLGEAMVELANDLSSAEVAAVNRFADAGKTCLSTLSAQVAGKLRDVFANDSSTHLEEELCANQEQYIEEMFQGFDVETAGHLSRDELEKALNDLLPDCGIKPSQVDKVMRRLDRNKDGKIDIREFSTWLCGQTSSRVAAAPPVTRAATTGFCQSKRTDNMDLEQELSSVKKALHNCEEKREQVDEAWHGFISAVAETSAGSSLPGRVDMESVDWLGSGNYGFVFKSRRVSGDKRGEEVVVKIMGLRWAHVAMQEWAAGTAVRSHPCIVKYAEVFWHRDKDGLVRELVTAGLRFGALRTKNARTTFPEHYICLVQEFMNRGTLQNWIDRSLLLPGAVFVVMERVAQALAYLHGRGLTHNDIKPENVMLRQNEIDGTYAAMHVKLGDLGLTKRSRHFDPDYKQFCMTVFCMLSGEQFGAKKLTADDIQGFDVERSLVGAEGDRVETELRALPELLHRIFTQDISMKELVERKELQDWSFFDGEISEGQAQTLPMAPMGRYACRRHLGRP
eukprot:TRINITY_DN2885_c0_g3_i1.p1 TRINITY_DN2885_c0_g3~~TRINITY_DN2885_c0_g3_i1.p1  ORF type:complete len:533 (-),score=102.77 TRINITY_DN2885_c0_g3_i1:342-1940(-)